MLKLLITTLLLGVSAIGQICVSPEPQTIGTVSMGCSLIPSSIARWLMATDFPADSWVLIVRVKTSNEQTEAFRVKIQHGGGVSSENHIRNLRIDGFNHTMFIIRSAQVKDLQITIDELAAIVSSHFR